MSDPSQTNIFTCTFCFHVFQGPPQIIGRSARLACSTCHAALLNLAICWVCGELIFRGDECVSFGWCFWHRACYGCLLYGSRAICQGVPVQDLFLDDELEGQARDDCGGKEVTEVPLCAVCVVEVEVDRVTDQNVVVKRGLKRVEKVDGGLTRKRWEANTSERGSKSPSTWQPSRHSTEGGVANHEVIVNNVSIDSRDASRSVIWVDIFDPINRPSFKPGPLKPIPLFMQRSPSPADPLQRILTTNDKYLQAPPPLRKPHSAPDSVCPSEPPMKDKFSDHYDTHQALPALPVYPAPRSPGPSRERDSQQIYTANNQHSELRHKQAVSWVKEEPLKRPSSRLAPSRRRPDINRSDANSSAYRTPPEYPDQVLRTPYPLPLSSIRSASPLPSQLTSHLQQTADAAPQSSEYLDRYQPAMTRPIQNQEVRRLRRVVASVSEEGLGKTRSDYSEGSEWGKVGSELRRFFTGR
ncbi:Ff.00g120140.m01.CDS01 [Fusarium sp. VM40]|nr:Ff.00g120140.m01.CDS01 [Fusarium sp. VM40]